MQKRIAELRPRYAADAEASGVLARLAREIEFHGLYSEYYAYEFLVAARSG
jgi:hypothetical protein